MKPSLDLDGLLDDVTLFYDDLRNVIIDEGGYIVYNIFSIITPNTLRLFRYYKDHMIVRGIHGQTVELIWPEHEYEDLDWDSMDEPTWKRYKDLQESERRYNYE